MSSHVMSLREQKPTTEFKGGSVQSLSADEFPLLSRLSIRRLVLQPGQIREPHWHTNANELNYCLRGAALITVFDNGSQYHRFTIREGQMFYVPSGALHTIEVIGDETAEFIATLTHERPEEFGLSGSLAVMSDAVIGNTFDLPATAVGKRNHEVRDGAIQEAARRPEPTRDDQRLDPFKFDVEAMSAPVASAEGWAKTARKQFWPVLDNVAMYSLKIADSGMREPHWHPETAEMGYIAKGTGRMTILSPDGTWDTFELHEGDVYFIPRSYPHHIEDIGEGDIHFLIFFDQPMPRDIGYRAALSALRPETVAAAFDVAPEDLPALPFTPADPLIVGRVNQVDRV
ncbi:cupin domain-containing protein [Paractinoplanes atraurantiacus]|uniref:Oxalate decarboxylase n=1 Tax=Paractinoplanes atraurantiacus TaxID=1036182 RepID=A0A285IIT3_9ACTN|nr:cupin domain-containing protein [Actinoplanes atraurantiacus]SNY47813.1 oxalate decarboxylase [Actinoplanes atraurantiacus]